MSDTPTSSTPPDESPDKPRAGTTRRPDGGGPDPRPADGTPGRPRFEESADRPAGRLEASIELEASAEDVWQALTDARELMRWFPLEAEVEPGEGGSIRMGWGEYAGGTADIEVWEPGRRLRVVWASPGADAGDDGPEVSPPRDDAGEAVPMATDYRIETRAGHTVLRVVQSGFGEGAEWDDWFDGTRRGWAYELRGLRHYLAWHRGSDRRVTWVRQASELTPREAWSRLLGAGGLARSGSLQEPDEGEGYEVVTAAGDELRGTVLLRQPPFQLALTIDPWRRALLRAGDEGTGPTARTQLYLETWGVPDAELRRTESGWSGLLAGLVD